MLQDRTEEEKNVHMELETFLKRQHAVSEVQLYFNS